MSEAPPKLTEDMILAQGLDLVLIECHYARLVHSRDDV
jgi:hypothetical protein